MARRVTGEGNSAHLQLCFHLFLKGELCLSGHNKKKRQKKDKRKEWQPNMAAQGTHVSD